jgi:hypothetical protein
MLRATSVPAKHKAALIRLLSLNLSHEEIGQRIGLTRKTVKLYAHFINRQLPGNGKYGALHQVASHHEQTQVGRWEGWLARYQCILTPDAVSEFRTILEEEVAEVFNGSDDVVG